MMPFGRCHCLSYNSGKRIVLLDFWKSFQCSDFREPTTIDYIFEFPTANAVGSCPRDYRIRRRNGFDKYTTVLSHRVQATSINFRSIPFAGPANSVALNTIFLPSFTPKEPNL